jgi:excisionase family DNA binding protein
MLTVKEVTSITRLSKSAVYALIKKGVLPGITLGGCNSIRVHPADLRRYLGAADGSVNRPARET